MKTDEIYVVEGYVENYHPMPYEGHDTEHFEIDGVYFEYSDYTIMNGYNISASHGGVVTNNGQYLKIKYINDVISELEVKGHSNFAPKGSDIVCAGVSAIVVGGINAIILYISEIGDNTSDGEMTLDE